MKTSLPVLLVGLLLAWLGLNQARAQRPLPPLDLHPSAHLQTAVFALG